MGQANSSVSDIPHNSLRPRIGHTSLSPISSLTPTSRTIPPTNANKRKRDNGSESDDTGAGKREEKRLRNDVSYHDLEPELKHASDYMFNDLFQQGLGSDVCVTALGHSWNLHKLFLRQSKFFACWFSGRWQNEDDKYVELTITDPNIDVAALTTCFASMYGDNYTISPDGLVSLIAGATLLQLDNLLDRCFETAKEYLDIDSVITLYEAGQAYGHTQLEEYTYKWIEGRLFMRAAWHTHTHTNTLPVNILMEVSIELMEKLVASPALVVMTMEMDVYALCCIWMYIQQNRSNVTYMLSSKANQEVENEIPTLSSMYYETYKLNPDNEGVRFLHSSEGLPYSSVFKFIRLGSIVNEPQRLRLMEEDGIVPEEWINTAVRQSWLSLLKLGQVSPMLVEKEMHAMFDKMAFRLGRCLLNDRTDQWRWTGCYAGLDLVMKYWDASREISITRNNTLHESDSVKLVRCATTLRRVLLRLKLMTFDENGHLAWHHTTELIDMALGKDAVVHLADVPNGVQFPVYISLHILLVSPIGKM
eukprot:CFRG5587T1